MGKRFLYKIRIHSWIVSQKKQGYYCKYCDVNFRDGDYEVGDFKEGYLTGGGDAAGGY